MAKDLIGNPISAEMFYVHPALFVEKGKKYYVQFSAEVERPEGMMLETFKMGCKSKEEAEQTRDDLVAKIKEHGKVLLFSMKGLPLYKGK